MLMSSNDHLLWAIFGKAACSTPFYYWDIFGLLVVKTNSCFSSMKNVVRKTKLKKFELWSKFCVDIRI